ncbi:hypothetical protein jhhlp_006015 [Lomentospora prolificans]|uniref:VWFA domain-containing protein n=1 Tax=Lomentospora prolificans TaxID=41688 RepID=A0A2N3N4T8_9PEZI|nr:hypothetical protein jhhlp_006015 [Lomentospora prolificans]
MTCPASSLFRLLLSLLLAGLVVADPDHEIDTANWLRIPVSDIDGFNPTPWRCSGAAPNVQTILEFHRNWHCTNPDRSSFNWGRRFFGFHKQFLQGYNRYLASIGEPNIQTWVAAKDAPVPPAHGSRQKNAICTACLDLADDFKVPAVGGRLDTYQTVSKIAEDIVRWHNLNHGFIGSSGGCSDGCSVESTAARCGDMACPHISPRDPIFYRYHHLFDDIQDAWRTLKPTDIAIVLDRSGSMSSNTPRGGTKLEAAKTAAALFADLLEDGSNHQLGMVSFSSRASSPPDMPLTSVANAPAALQQALSGLTASGTTSIGDGLIKAQELIGAGPEERKAILLLTDGMENSAPMIANAIPTLGDTHVCSVGFGLAGELDGAKLQSLTEQQGGIHISTPDDLELRKFFVFCFANIFDTFVGEDPLATLGWNETISSPTIHHSLSDEKLVFILSWRNTTSGSNLRLSITSPSGSVVDLQSPGVESKVGQSWHIVRFNLPLLGERDGNWTARAVRPIHNFVNGFTSRSFEDPEEGVALVKNEIAALCHGGCNRTLYFEDSYDGGQLFADRESMYGGAIYSQPLLSGEIIRANNASEFAQILKGGQHFDLLVYSSQYTKDEQPYDGELANSLCRRRFRSIISDNRRVRGAEGILKCAGTARGQGTEFKLITPGPSKLLDGTTYLTRPDGAIEGSYEVRALDASTTPVQATFEGGQGAVIAVGDGGEDEEYFITVLTRSMGKVKPYQYHNNTYTTEPLHPTFHIPATHWPSCGYSRVNATVSVTRPLASLSGLLYAAAQSSKGTNPTYADDLDPRAIAASTLNASSIPTETQSFILFDDGTHGDTTANDHYWEIDLPAGFTEFDGEYQLHAYFTLCQISSCGRETCVKREAQQTITVHPRLHTECKYHVDKSSIQGYTDTKTVTFYPIDVNGCPLGPGYTDHLVVSGCTGVQVIGVGEDGYGGYQANVSYVPGNGQQYVTIAQYGRPSNLIKVYLS